MNLPTRVEANTIDEMLKGTIPRVAQIGVRGKLVVVGERNIRIRG